MLNKLLLWKNASYSSSDNKMFIIIKPPKISIPYFDSEFEVGRVSVFKTLSSMFVALSRKRIFWHCSWFRNSVPKCILSRVTSWLKLNPFPNYCWNPLTIVFCKVLSLTKIGSNIIFQQGLRIYSVTSNINNPHEVYLKRNFITHNWIIAKYLLYSLKREFLHSQTWLRFYKNQCNWKLFFFSHYSLGISLNSLRNIASWEKRFEKQLEVMCCRPAVNQPEKFCLWENTDHSLNNLI